MHQEILSRGHYFSIHSKGTRECIGLYGSFRMQILGTLGSANLDEFLEKLRRERLPQIGGRICFGVKSYFILIVNWLQMPISNESEIWFHFKTNPSPSLRKWVNPPLSLKTIQTLCDCVEWKVVPQRGAFRRKKFSGFCPNEGGGCLTQSQLF